ncbi:MAG TPA: metal-dependent hydrolase [Pyrinomonadaceae bacterium]|nr:metal-dependent hydrolase [Pyrinomonadaceae bacterium]
MDNLTHSLVGLAAAKAGLERKSAYAASVCVVAANLPDIDIVTLARGPSVYLANHRGITHSIIGTLALAVAFPLLFFAAERLTARLRGRAPRANLKGLLICSLLLSASHPLLDLLNNYGLRPFLPWDGRWFYGDILFIADPWIWLALGGACFLLTTKTGLRAVAWAALVLTLFLFVSSGRFGPGVPVGIYAVWLAGLAALFALHRLRAAERWGASVAVAALALVVAYCGALALIHARALEEAKAAANNLTQDGEKVLRVAAMPTAADPFAWRCVAETDRASFRFDQLLGASGGEDARDLFRIEKPEGEAREIVARASTDARARVLLDFARFPVERVRRGDGGAAFVDFADLRFTEPGSRVRVGGFALEVEVPPGR